MTASDVSLSVHSPTTNFPSADRPSRARIPQAGVDPLFLDRWSPRAFLSEPIDQATLDALFEAARWAPSSANEQPWVFVYATQPADRARFAEALMDMNRVWASKAPVLVYLLARRRIRQGTWAGQPNPTAWFDSGAAWMSLALQAQMLGISAHALGGIDREKAAEILGVPRDEYDVVIAIALGRRADPENLPPSLAEREKPSGRLPLRAIANEGRFPRELS
jgi:nitroreductase